MTNQSEAKTKIILVATKMFTKYGYDGSSMYWISKNTGITKATMYHHFKNKEDLLKLCVHKYVNDFKDLLSKNSLKNSLKIFYGNSDHGCLIFNLLATDHYKIVQNYVDEFIHILESYIGDSVIDLIGSLVLRKSHLYNTDPVKLFCDKI